MNYRVLCILGIALFPASQSLLGQMASFSQTPPDKPMFSRLTDGQERLFREVRFTQETPTGGKKSVGLAVLYSFLLPGMGEYYVGEYGVGKYFSIIEGALWITYGAVHIHGDWLRDDARSFSAAHAQVKLEGKSDQYFVDIGSFDDIYGHNEQVLRNRDPQKVYDPRSDFFWSWDNTENRQQYRELRITGDNAINNRRFVIAAIAVNHLISGINAARLAISHNKSIASELPVSIHAGVMGGWDRPHGIVLSVSKSF